MKEDEDKNEKEPEILLNFTDNKEGKKFIKIGTKAH